MNIPSGWTSTHYDTPLRLAFFIKLCFHMLFKRRMRTSRNSRWMNRRRSSSLRGKSLFSFYYFLRFIFFCKWIKCAYWIQFLWWKKIFASQYILECIKRRMRDISYVEYRMGVKADPSCTVLYIRCKLKFDSKIIFLPVWTLVVESGEQ